MTSLGPAELLILLLIVPLVIQPIWALVDAALRPDRQWAAADQNKTLWVLLLAVGLFLPLVGFVLLVVYLASIRPQLKRTA
jgi:hypothetical protein